MRLKDIAKKGEAMSIILKGIDLPTNGETLIVGIYGNGLVSVEHSKPLVLPIEINADAIQIPKSHGRLIDADKIDYDEFWHREGQGFTIAVCQGAEKIIDEQPTILEAEEEDVHKSNV